MLKRLVLSALLLVLLVQNPVPALAETDTKAEPPPKPSPTMPAPPTVTDDSEGRLRVRAILVRTAQPRGPSSPGIKGPRPSGPPPLTPYQRWQHMTRLLPECNGIYLRPEEWCAWEEPPPGQPTRPPRRGVETVVREVVTRLQLPPADPFVGPDPSWNEWKMAVVGHPLWLWVEGPSTLRSTNSAYGVEITLTATHTHTSFDMGDGTKVNCATTQPYRRESVDPGAPSPVCGHTYAHAPRDGAYPVVATTHWDVAWSAAGYSGTLTTTMRATRRLPVGELQAVVVRR